MEQNAPQYPNEFFRGINNADYITEDGLVRSTPFTFNQSDETGTFFEESINWNDDTGSITNLFRQQKNGKTQFHVGAFVFSYREFFSLMKKPMAIGRLECNRAELPDNKYHGNLKIRKGPSQSEDTKYIRLVASSIAFDCFIQFLPNKEGVEEKKTSV